MSYIRGWSATVLVLRIIPIAISLGCLTCLAADRPRLCADQVACRWPTANQLFQQATPSAADSWVNELTAEDGFAVESVQHYPSEK